MSDHTTNGGFDYEAPARKPAPRTEFAIYFAIIFAACLPLACVAWALSLLKNGNFANKGPVSRAWSQAWIITPMIFAA